MSYFIRPDSEAFFRSGLAKSAFRNTIYSDMPLDYYLPQIHSTRNLTKELINVLVKLYHAHDAYLSFYQPYQLVYSSLKKSNKVAPLWHKIMTKAISDPKFLDLNQLTRQSSELSIVAAAKFLSKFFVNREHFRNFEDKQELYQKLQKSLQGLDPNSQQAQEIRKQIEELEEKVESQDARFAIDAINEALEAVQGYMENSEVAEEAAMTLGGPGGSWYTKEALSVWSFLKKPDEFRRRVKILRLAKECLTKFMAITPTSLVHQQLASIYGGTNGVTKMTSEKQLSDILPSELVVAQLGDVGRALFAVKVAQKQLMTYQRAATTKPVVFVDKSGSMACEFSYYVDVPKISVAAGFALALHRKLNADVYLFDTECEPVSPAKIIETLLKIEADGGTNIDPVLEEIMRIGKEEYVYVIVSDGITEASEGVLKKFEESGLAKRTKLIAVPPGLGARFKWVEVLKAYKNVRDVKDVAEFEKAAVNAITS
jgi:uncharacterized protein with von Willebrand factor type A (vWA) domain